MYLSNYACSAALQNLKQVTGWKNDFGLKWLTIKYKNKYSINDERKETEVKMKPQRKILFSATGEQ